MSSLPLVLTNVCILSALTDGWQNFHRLIRSDVVGQMNAMFEQGRFPVMYRVIERPTNENRPHVSSRWREGYNHTSCRRRSIHAVSTADSRQL